MSALTQPWNEALSRLAGAEALAEVEGAICQALAELRRAAQSGQAVEELQTALRGQMSAETPSPEGVAAAYLLGVLLFDCGYYGRAKRALQDAESLLAKLPEGARPVWSGVMTASLRARRALLSWRLGQFQQVSQEVSALLARPARANSTSARTRAGWWAA
jgi:hypothetical protein